MPAKSNPLRQEINRHLWNYHQQSEVKGTLHDRLAVHDMLHAQGNEDLSTGTPLHRHVGATADSAGIVIEIEGEGTE